MPLRCFISSANPPAVQNRKVATTCRLFDRSSRYSATTPAEIAPRQPHQLPETEIQKIHIVPLHGARLSACSRLQAAQKPRPHHRQSSLLTFDSIPRNARHFAAPRCAVAAHTRRTPPYTAPAPNRTPVPHACPSPRPLNPTRHPTAAPDPHPPTPASKSSHARSRVRYCSGFSQSASSRKSEMTITSPRCGYFEIKSRADVKEFVAPPGFNACKNNSPPAETVAAPRPPQRIAQPLRERLQINRIQPHQRRHNTSPPPASAHNRTSKRVPCLHRFPLMSSNIRTGMRGSSWNIFRNIFPAADKRAS